MARVDRAQVYATAIAKAVAPHPRLQHSVTEDRAPVLSAVPMDDEVWCISMDHGGGVLSAGREFGIRRKTLRGGTRGIGYFVTHGFSFYRITAMAYKPTAEAEHLSTKSIIDIVLQTV